MDSDATGCECFPEPSRAIRFGDSMIPPLSGRCNTIWKHDYNLIIVKFLDHLFIYLRTGVKFFRLLLFKHHLWFHFIRTYQFDLVLIFRQAWGSSLRGLEISQLSISMTESNVFQTNNFRKVKKFWTFRSFVSKLVEWNQEILPFRSFFFLNWWNETNPFETY